MSKRSTKKVTAERTAAPDVEITTTAVQQFELELCWCIQQLQGALTTSKMNSKESNNALRSLNVLKNNNAPLVKKRQVMRTSFGDYREKMAEEEKKFKKASPCIKMATTTPSKHSVFLKQSAYKCKKLESSDNSFRFNFDIAKETSVQEDGSEPKQIPEHVSSFKYQSSDNSFRFDFPVKIPT